MRIKLLGILLSLVLFGCRDQMPTKEDVVNNYFEAFDAGNYAELSQGIGDSIIIVEGDYVMPYTRAAYYEVFKWDSVFRPSYEVLDMTQAGDQLLITVSSTSERYRFLKNNPMVCQRRISFRSGKISKIETLDCPGVDWSVWQSQRDSLVEWTSRHHPELDGFIHDMTLSGAVKYSKAIELYQAREVE